MAGTAAARSESSVATPLVAAEGLSLTLGAGSSARAVLRDASVELASGELLAIAGRRGAGKSMLLRVLAGLQPPDAGSVRVDDEEIWQVSAGRRRELRRGLLALIPEGGALPLDLTIAEAIEQPLRIAGFGRADRRARAAELIELTGLDRDAGKRPLEASRGASALAAVARALALRPRIVLADEPTAGVPPAIAERIWELLAPITARQGAVLVATDDEAVAARADRSVALSDGVVSASSASGLRALPAPGARELG